MLWVWDSEWMRYEVRYWRVPLWHHLPAKTTCVSTHWLRGVGGRKLSEISHLQPAQARNEEDRSWMPRRIRGLESLARPRVFGDRTLPDMEQGLSMRALKSTKGSGVEAANH